MDFLRKLSLLRGPPVAVERARELVSPAFEAAPEPEPALLGVSIDEAVPAEHDRERVLHDLRSKIADLMGRAPVEKWRAEPSDSTLAFVKLESEAGTLYRRLERLSPSHHVGRIPVDAAASANRELLALLALDPSLAFVSFERALFVDTETTGLGGGAGVLPFLVGLAWFDAERRLFVEQLLLRRPSDEPALLARLRECVERAEVLVTYNGKAFDLPLLAGRYVMNHLPPLPARPHLDLLHVARRLHRRRLAECRLISLESAVLGFGRGPDVEGADIAARYGHFLRTGDESALVAVVGHNAWDVVSMAALVGLYGEPLDLLPAADLVGLARTLRRAGAIDQAHDVAHTAVERGGGAHARRARGEIAKARGDRARALVDFESLLDELDEPAVRLELAKLYEHYVKSPEQALAVLARGTGEAAEAEGRRRSRLERKLEAKRVPRASKPRRGRS